MEQKEPTFLHTFVSLLFWGALTYCALFYVPKQFKWYYSWAFIEDYAPMIKWTLILLPFGLWLVRGVLKRKKNKNAK